MNKLLILFLVSLSAHAGSLKFGDGYYCAGKASNSQVTCEQCCEEQLDKHCQNDKPPPAYCNDPGAMQKAYDSCTATCHKEIDTRGISPSK